MDFTRNGEVQDLDLSGIIGTGKKLIKIRIVVKSDNAGRMIEFRKKGNSNWVNAISCRTQAGNISIDYDIEIECDVNGKIEYKGVSSPFGTIDFTVRGWFIF